MTINPDDFSSGIAHLTVSLAGKLAGDDDFVAGAARAVILCERITRGARGAGSRLWDSMDARTRESLCGHVKDYLTTGQSDYFANWPFGGLVVDEMVRIVQARQRGKAERDITRRHESTPRSRARHAQMLGALLVRIQADADASPPAGP